MRTAYLREPAGINPVHGRAPVRAAVAAASTTTALRILELPDPGPAVDDLRPLLRKPRSQDRKQLARNTSPTLMDIMRLLWP
ncbi:MULTISPECIES: hypothetical protein [Pseudofrankia]|uniref:hypothetical protein n=1 Tax=Pseudofrankia TaxID=2994363 RepID=UPI000234B219|nr:MULTISPECIES: hypothetical protein [Pseudofrankia]OHV38453.1 hypothetical protein BCD49_13355 [Pseudofrankia sp. EUN1h]